MLVNSTKATGEGTCRYRILGVRARQEPHTRTATKRVALAACADKGSCITQSTLLPIACHMTDVLPRYHRDYLPPIALLRSLIAVQPP
jgi:hypothetical protein